MFMTEATCGGIFCPHMRKQMNSGVALNISYFDGEMSIATCMGIICSQWRWYDPEQTEAGVTGTAAIVRRGSDEGPPDGEGWEVTHDGGHFLDYVRSEEHVAETRRAFCGIAGVPEYG